jgi:hypothetical protein
MDLKGAPSQGKRNIRKDKWEGWRTRSPMWFGCIAKRKGPVKAFTGFGA